MTIRSVSLFFVLLIGSSTYAEELSFGVADHQFSMQFVKVGNPGNDPDEVEGPLPPGIDAIGDVRSTFLMGKYEVTVAMINAANASAELDGTGGNLELAPEVVRLVDENAVEDLRWEAAARFVNWMNTTKGFPPAYNFNVQPGEEGYSPIPRMDRVLEWDEDDPGYDTNNPLRNKLARFVLPSWDEWHKSAYHDAASGTDGVYFDYPTGSNSVPTPVASGTDQDTAVWGQSPFEGPAPATRAGGLSPYGTMAQGGNAWEHQESYPRDTVTWIRGGYYGAVFPHGMEASNNSVGSNLALAGFRVAAVFSSGDFDGDGDLSDADIDLLSEQVRVESLDTFYDLNRDGAIDSFDRIEWVEKIATTNFGDADLDGEVAFDDFLAVVNNFDQPSSWGGGDFDGNGMTDIQDFLALANNFGASNMLDVAVVPEPSSLVICFGMLGLFLGPVRTFCRPQLANRPTMTLLTLQRHRPCGGDTTKTPPRQGLCLRVLLCSSSARSVSSCSGVRVLVR